MRPASQILQRRPRAVALLAAAALCLAADPAWALDLQCAVMTLSPEAAEIGTPLEIQLTLTATDGQPSSAVSIGVYASRDAAWDPLMDALIHRTAYTLAPDQAQSVELVFTLPRETVDTAAPVPVGPHTILVVIDDLLQHPETDETNNVGRAVPEIEILAAELEATSVMSAPTAFVLAPFRVTLELDNRGTAPARIFRYAIYLSNDPTIRVFDRQLVNSATVSLGANSSAIYSEDVVIPTDVMPGPYYLGAIVDIEDAVFEPNPSNNIGRRTKPITVAPPAPNLRGEIITAPAFAGMGEAIFVQRQVWNVGVAPSPETSVRYVLTADEHIDEHDATVGRATQPALAIDTDTLQHDRIFIEDPARPGRYRLGLQVNDGFVVQEISTADNDSIGPTIEVFAAALRFLAHTLPTATKDVPYVGALVAEGGPRTPLRYAVVDGALPPGIVLNPDGVLSGTPEQGGVYDFTAEVTSADVARRRSFSIAVAEDAIPLSVFTDQIQPAILGRGYRARILAGGGVLPYVFGSVGPLPTGLILHEDGQFEGVPTRSGRFVVGIRVRDAIGSVSQKTLTMYVSDPAQATKIPAQFLPSGILDLEYCRPNPLFVRAEGGLPPYTFRLLGGAPEGFLLTPDGRLCGTPRVAGDYAISVAVHDTNGEGDTATLPLRVDGGRELVIDGRPLPDARAGFPYNTRVVAEGERGMLTWSYTPSEGRLPPGLALSREGSISGTPTAKGLYAFAVTVEDEVGRTAHRALSIFVEERVVAEDRSCGCQSAQDRPTHGTLVWSWLALSMLLLLRARRRMAVGAGLVVALTLLSSEGRAQTYVVSSEAITYVPLTAPTILSTDGDDETYTVQIPFPFRFYGVDYNQISAGTNGAISLGVIATIPFSNQTPGNSNLDAWIAPMWDDLQLFAVNTAYLGHALEGFAPTRALAIEYRAVSRFSTPEMTMSFTIRLHEGRAGRVTIDYGTAAGAAAFSATMAIESGDGAQFTLISPSGCTNNCSQAELLVDTRVTLVADGGPDVAPSFIGPPSVAFLESPAPVDVVIESLHGQPLGPFALELRASRDPGLGNSTAVGSLTGVSLSPFETQRVTVDMIVPAALGVGTYFLEVNADSGGAVAEIDEVNNRLVSPAPVLVQEVAPDLTITSIAGLPPGVHEPGDQFSVELVVNNVGGLRAQGEVAVVLSSNAVISAQDLLLGSAAVDLPPSSSSSVTVGLTIPIETNSGSYRVGGFADPNAELMETSEANNAFLAAEVLVIDSGALALVSSNVPPPAVVGEPYTFTLGAVGGNGAYSWAVSQGMLPAGLSLGAADGTIVGRAQEVGSSAFDVTVSSSTFAASQTLTIDVIDQDLPLTIISVEVPRAQLGQEYAFLLRAAGGTSTAAAAWTSTGLPAGITLTSVGLLMGTPVAVGTTTFDATATRGAESVTRTFPLLIEDARGLQMLPKALPIGDVGMPYAATFEASGGLPPLSFSVEDGTLPPGLALSLQGQLSGTPSAIGAFRVTIAVRDSGAEGIVDVDRNAFEITIRDPGDLAFVEAALPAARIGESYDVSVTAEGGTPPYVFSVVEGDLPLGILGNDNPGASALRIVGTTSLVGVYNLLAEVKDAEGRRSTRTYALEVTGADADSGCSCGTQRSRNDLTWLLALAGLALIVIRRSNGAARP